MPIFDTVLFIPTERELKKIFRTDPLPYEQNFSAGLYKDVPVIVTGIGKANAALTAAMFFSKYSVKKAALVGICGAYEASTLNIGETVSVKYDYFADECVYDGSKITTLAEKGMPPSNNNRAEFKVWKGFKAAVSNTVSFIPAEEKISELFRTKTKADIENMEGAAFGAAANYFKILPYQIRTVSNYCGKPETQRWDIDKACENMRLAADKFLE